MGLQLLVVSAGCFVPGLVQGGYDFGWVAWRGAIFTGIGRVGDRAEPPGDGPVALPPTRTALLLMIEPVSAAVIGYPIGERLGVAGTGSAAALILGGVVLAESRRMRENPMNTRQNGIPQTPYREEPREPSRSRRRNCRSHR